jgi:hypothetical protein
MRLGAADRPDDGVVGHQRVERREAEPHQPQVGPRRPLLDVQASPQGLAGQDLVRAANALDEDDAIVPVSSPGIPLQ